MYLMVQDVQPTCGIPREDTSVYHQDHLALQVLRIFLPTGIVFQSQSVDFGAQKCSSQLCGSFQLSKNTIFFAALKSPLLVYVTLALSRWQLLQKQEVLYERVQKKQLLSIFFFSQIWEAAQRQTVEGITQGILSLSPLVESQQTKPTVETLMF